MNAMPKSIEKTVHPAVLEEHILRSLATELARDIHEADEILERFDISPEAYAHLAKTRAFQDMLAQASKEWGAVNNTTERVKLKSAALIEEALPEMFLELTNKENTLTSRADLFGRIAKLGGLGEAAKADPDKGERFVISINIGADKPVTVNTPLLSGVIEGDFEEV